MKRLTYDFEIGGNHCWQIKGADNLECREVCERQEDNGCKTCPISKAFDRLAAIEDILGDEYDLEKLKELVQAKREGRCVVLPVRGYTDKDGEKALNSAMHTLFYHNNPVTRYIADAVAEKLTREADESALKGEQNG